MKFRIINKIYSLLNIRHYSSVYYIQRRVLFFYWKTITIKEVNTSSLSFKTYEEAEQYMIKNYMTGEDSYTRNNNIYKSSRFSYYCG